MTTPHPLAGTIFTTSASAATSCTMCTKRGTTLERVQRADIECGHVACPNRRRPTAQANDQLPKDDE